MGQLGDLSVAAPPRVRTPFGPFLLALTLALTGTATAASQADEYRLGSLVIKDPWSRPTPPGISVGVVYLSITNAGPRADRLVSVSSPRAPHVELHETRSANGVMEMRQVDGVDCPPGATVRSAPGGLHVMLLGLDAPLTAGSRFDLILGFRDGGTITVPVRVEARVP